jgi:hypothetical protein
MNPSKKETDEKAAPQIKPVSDEAILKVAKEIAVKFIEVGRLSPNNFGETFLEIYQSIRDTVRS